MLTYCYDHWKQLHKEGLNETASKSISTFKKTARTDPRSDWVKPNCLIVH